MSNTDYKVSLLLFLAPATGALTTIPMRGVQVVELGPSSGLLSLGKGGPHLDKDVSSNPHSLPEDYICLFLPEGGPELIWRKVSYSK